MSSRMERFLAFSSDMTCFEIFQLLGTGQAQAYLDAADDAVGADLVDALLTAFGSVPVGEPNSAARKSALRREILGDATLGPIARNIIKLWYLGIWYQLPRAWIEANGAREANVTCMVSAAAYTEGLLWPAIGANPPGAKAPGYASWVGPPQIPSF